MKTKLSIFIGLIIALVLVLTITIPAVAKPAPVIEYGSVTYNGLDGADARVYVNNICWQNFHPYTAGVYLRSNVDTDSREMNWRCPTGKFAKYPQNFSPYCDEIVEKFTPGELVKVYFFFNDRKGNRTWGNNNQPVATIQWGLEYPSV